MAGRESAMTMDPFGLGEELEELLREEERMAAAREGSAAGPRSPRPRSEAPGAEQVMLDSVRSPESTEDTGRLWTVEESPEFDSEPTTAHSAGRIGASRPTSPQFPARVYAVPGYTDSNDNILSWAAGSPNSIFTSRGDSPSGSSNSRTLAPNPVGTFAGLPPDMALAALPAAHHEPAPFRQSSRASRRQGSYFQIPPQLPTESSTSPQVVQRRPTIGEPGYTMRFTREELLLWREDDRPSGPAPSAPAPAPGPRSQFEWDEPAAPGCFGGMIGCLGRFWSHPARRR